MAPAATANGSAPATNGHHASVPSTSKGKDIDFTTFLSSVAKARQPSPIRALFPAEHIPGMLSLLAGKPNVDTFPFERITVDLKPEPSKASTSSLQIEGDLLARALQYGLTLPELDQWLTDMQSRVHSRKPQSTQSPWKVTIGDGSQDLLNKTFEALLNAGDCILVESPAYAGVLPCMRSLNANIVAVESDDQGVSPIALRQLLSQWRQDPSTAEKAFPKCLYTTPTGGNPSGTTASEERKRQVLAIMREFDVLLLEDDPYYFLNFAGLGQDPATRPRARSYFNLDAEDADVWGSGRVLRFDSFSKVISGGMRLGFMTAHPTFVRAVDMATASSNLQVSGVIQAIGLSILQHWGLSGFLEHCDRVATFYKERRDRFEGTAQRVLGTNNGSQPAVAEWVTPTAGMFLWLKLRLPPAEATAGAAGTMGESAHAADNEGDSFPLISEKAKAAGVLAVPGVAFMPTGARTCFVRTSFSLIPEEDFEEAFRRLRKVVLEAWEERGLQIPSA